MPFTLLTHEMLPPAEFRRVYGIQVRLPPHDVGREKGVLTWVFACARKHLADLADLDWEGEWGMGYFLHLPAGLPQGVPWSIEASGTWETTPMIRLIEVPGGGHYTGWGANPDSYTQALNDSKDGPRRLKAWGADAWLIRGRCGPSSFLLRANSCVGGERSAGP